MTDADVEKYLRLFTLMSLNDIEEIMAAHVVRRSTHRSPIFSLIFIQIAPEKRRAQHRLAAEVTEMVHTSLSLEKIACMKTEKFLALETGALRATSVSKLLFSSEYADLKFEDIVASFGDDPRLVKISKLEMLGTPITKLASKHGLVSSTCKNTLVNDRYRLFH